MEFNPPSWLIQDYLNRKTPAEQASQGIGGALSTYANYKESQDKEKTAKLEGYVKAFGEGGPGLAADYAKRVGLDNPPALPGMTKTMAAGQPAGTMVAPGPQPSQAPPQQAPTAAEDTAQMSMPSEHPQDQSSPIIAHWNQTMGPGQGAQTPRIPGSPDVVALADQGRYGKNKLSTLESAARLTDSQDATAQRNAPQPVLTREAAVAAGTVPANARIVEPPDHSTKDQNRQNQLAKAVTDYGKQIETNPVVGALQKQDLGLHNVEEMEHLTANGNTVASAAMGMKMARAMGEVGVVTENDVKRYVQSRKLSQAAADKLSGWLNGVPSKPTLDEISQITGVLRDSYSAQVQPIYNRYIERFARAYKMTNEDAAYQLAFPYDKGTGSAAPEGGGLPEVGGTFHGGRVLKVTMVKKAQK